MENQIFRKKCLILHTFLCLFDSCKIKHFNKNKNLIVP